MNPWAIGAGALLGAAAGGQKDRQTSGIDLAPASQLELQGGSAVGQNFTQLGQMVGGGPGRQDVSNAYGTNLQLSDMLKKYSQGGFLPSQTDMATANQFAQSAFQPQATALKQQFTGQQQRAAQLAAQLGRPVNDPIIQAKLSQEYMQGQERLQASQGAYANQFAMALPQQRLGYTQQLADVQNSLASQAMANRQALLSLGSQIQTSERNFRLATGTRWGESGGGFKGMLTGALGGASAFMGLGQQWQDLNKAPTTTTATTAQPSVASKAMSVAQAFHSPMGEPNAGPQLPSYSAPQQTAVTPTPVFNMFGQARYYQAPTTMTQQEGNLNYGSSMMPNQYTLGFMGGM